MSFSRMDEFSTRANNRAVFTLVHFNDKKAPMGTDDIVFPIQTTDCLGPRHQFDQATLESALHELENRRLKVKGLVQQGFEAAEYSARSMFFSEDLVAKVTGIPSKFTVSLADKKNVPAAIEQDVPFKNLQGKLLTMHFALEAEGAQITRANITHTCLTQLTEDLPRLYGLGRRFTVWENLFEGLKEGDLLGGVKRALSQRASDRKYGLN